MVRSARDPGWPSAVRGLLFSLVPMLGARQVQRHGDGLTLMRLLWMSFVGAMTMIGVVVIVLELAGGVGSSIDAMPVLVGVAVLGVFAQLMAGRVVPAVSGDTAAEVVRRFQTSVLTRVAFAEVAALVGFVGFFVSGNPWSYAIGYVIAWTGMIDAAPTAARLDTAQQELQAAGSPVRLLDALLGAGITR